MISHAPKIRLMKEHGRGSGENIQKLAENAIPFANAPPGILAASGFALTVYIPALGHEDCADSIPP